MSGDEWNGGSDPAADSAGRGGAGYRTWLASVHTGSACALTTAVVIVAAAAWFMPGSGWILIIAMCLAAVGLIWFGLVSRPPVAEAEAEVEADDASALAEEYQAMERELVRKTLQVELLNRSIELTTTGQSFHQVLQRAVEIIGEAMSWAAGHALLRDEGTSFCVRSRTIGFVRPYEGYSAPEREAIRSFLKCAGPSSFQVGADLPGMVMESGMPITVPDLALADWSQRAEACRAVGLRGAFAFPVKVGGTVVAVLEFFSRDTLGYDLSLVTLAKTVGEQLGRVYEGHRAHCDLLVAKSKAEDANLSKTEFLANMSHELRTPLTAIIGFVEVLADSVSGSENLEQLAIVRRNGEHLLRLIDSVLDISKIESGKMTIEVLPCDLVAMLGDLRKVVSIGLAAKDLAMKIRFVGPTPSSIRSDPTRLQQILINLVGNAIKFTEMGSVEVLVRFEDGSTPRVEFDIVDTGIGMSEDQAGRLFQAFAQADTTISRRFGGSGLGLVISKQLAAMLGGDVTVVRTAPDDGTTLRASVACGPVDGVRMVEGPLDELLAASRITTRKPLAMPTLNCRILLAEDGPDNQRLIGHILRKAGADVHICENGKLAMETALYAESTDAAFDLILMDMQMPVMGGYEATESLRERGYRGPIIALTAHAMAGDRQRCLDAGCDEYSTKPIKRAELLSLIDGLVGGTPGTSRE